MNVYIIPMNIQNSHAGFYSENFQSDEASVLNELTCIA